MTRVLADLLGPTRSRGGASLCLGRSGNPAWSVNVGGAREFCKLLLEAPAIGAVRLTSLLDGAAPLSGYVAPMRIEAFPWGSGNVGLAAWYPWIEGVSLLPGAEAIRIVIQLWRELRDWSEKNRRIISDLQCAQVRPYWQSVLSHEAKVDPECQGLLACCGQYSLIEVLKAASTRTLEYFERNPYVAPDLTFVVHGDLHGGNILVPTDGTPPRIIDWDCVGIGDSRLDVAKAAWLLCRKRRGEFELEPELLTILVQMLAESGVEMSAKQLLYFGAPAFYPSSSHVRHLLFVEKEFDEYSGITSWYFNWLRRFFTDFLKAVDEMEVGNE